MLAATPDSSWLPVTLITLVLTYLSVLWYLQPRQADTQDAPEEEPSYHIDYFKLSGTPLPRPLLDFDVDKAKPRPYRPFRWKYFQTMAIMPLEHDWWIELESSYRARIAQRRELYSKHQNAILDCLPGSERACKELMFMAIQFLCARYPRLFAMDKEAMVFHNRVLETRFDVGSGDPLHFLLENVPEDFLITQKNEKTGEYFLSAGIACSAIGWNMATKIGKSMREVHQPVPDYKPMLQTSVDRFFDKMPLDKPVQRGSWSFEVGEPLYLQTDTPEYTEHKRVNPNLKVEDIHLRVDWQTLRRLPQSGAMVINFKALFTPLTQLQEEPYIPQLVCRQLKGAKSSIKEYKGWGYLEHALLPALEQWSKDQVERGMVPEGWEERTLDDHPFYPGWREAGGFD